jgi:hypothetical protein
MNKTKTRKPSTSSTIRLRREAVKPLDLGQLDVIVGGYLNPTIHYGASAAGQTC